MQEQLLEAVKKIDSETQRIDFRLGEVSYKNSVMVGKDFEFKLTPSGFDDICDTLDIPKIYAKRCPQDLQEQTINYWLKARGDTSYSALVTKDELRAFINPTYPYIPNTDILEAIDESIENEYEIQNFHIENNVLEAVLFSPEYDAEVYDSTVRAGLRIVYSDSWSAFPRFDSYLCRIQCLNSAISPVEHRKFRVSKKSGDEIVEQTKEFIKSSLIKVPQMIEGLGKLYEENVDHAETILKRICQENKLPNKILDELIATCTSPAFLSTMTNQKIVTMFDLVNVITWVASHGDLSDQHKEHLFAIAGNLMLHNSTRCVSCGGVVE